MTEMSRLRAQADFNAARAKAMFRELLALLTGRHNELLAFDDVASKLRVGGPIYRGVQDGSARPDRWHRQSLSRF